MIIKKANILVWKIADRFDQMRIKKQSAKHKSDNVVVKKDVSYGDRGADSLLDIYMPTNSDGPLPIIINIPGGGYTIGRKENNKLQSELLAQHGFAVITINYSHVDKIGFPEPVREVFGVLSFIETELDNSEVDKNNIFLMGDSAGAHIAALSAIVLGDKQMQQRFGVSSDFIIKGCVLFSSSFKILNIPFIKKSYKKAIYQNNIDLQDISSVIDNLNTGFPPAFVVCPKNDFLLSHSKAFVKKSQELGLNTKFVLLKTGKRLRHISMVRYSNDPSYQALYDDVVKFMKSYI